jgi:hypothetical protein
VTRDELLSVETEVMKFDYNLPAELFIAKRKGRLGYRRFATSAEAIRFGRRRVPCRPNTPCLFAGWGRTFQQR